MAQIINASELTKDIILDSNLLLKDFQYTTSRIDFPLSSMYQFRGNSYTYMPEKSFRIFQEMLAYEAHGEDPFSCFEFFDGVHEYNIDTLIQYYIEHPRNFGIVARKTSTARANNIGNAINIGEVARSLKTQITRLLHSFNSLFVGGIYTNEHFWHNQENDQEQLYWQEVNYQGYMNYYPYNTYSPVFKFEKDLSEFLYQSVMQDCHAFMNALLRSIVRHFGNLAAGNHFNHNEYDEDYLRPINTISNHANYEKSLRITKYRSLNFAKDQARTLYFMDLVVYTCTIIDIFLNVIIVNGALRDQRKERNRLTTRKILQRLTNISIFNEETRHSSNIGLLVSLFAGININKESAFKNLDHTLTVFKEGFSVPTLAANNHTISPVTLHKIKCVELWKPYLDALEVNINNIKSVFEEIVNIEEYLYNKFFTGSEIENIIKDAASDTTKPIIKIIPKLVSTIFKEATADDLNEVLFEKLVMAPLSFTSRRGLHGNYNYINATDFTFSYNDQSTNVIEGLSEYGTQTLDKNFVEILLDTEQNFNLENIHAENLCSASLDNKRFYFLLNTENNILSTNLITSGIYTQYLTTKESLGILLTYFIFFLNHGTHSANDNYYRDAPRCPADITVYTEDK